MILVLIGAPGAGKGTQADLLVATQGWHKISTGDALRKQIAKRTAVGLEAEGYVKAGRLVPDAVLWGVLQEELQAHAGAKILLDGFPRNIQQAEALQALPALFAVRAVAHLDVPEEDLYERLVGRRVCQGCGASYHVHKRPPQSEHSCDHCGGALLLRSDDQPEKIKVRLAIYEADTKPVLDFYKRCGLYHRIDGRGDTEAVAAQLSAFAASF